MKWETGKIYDKPKRDTKSVLPKLSIFHYKIDYNMPLLLCEPPFTDNRGYCFPVVGTFHVYLYLETFSLLRVQNRCAAFGLRRCLPSLGGKTIRCRGGFMQYVGEFETR